MNYTVAKGTENFCMGNANQGPYARRRPIHRYGAPFCHTRRRRDRLLDVPQTLVALVGPRAGRPPDEQGRGQARSATTVGGGVEKHRERQKNDRKHVQCAQGNCLPRRIL